MDEKTKKIIAYKGFDKNMQCHGFQYEVGKTYETEKVKVCECGFHACENPLDVLNYYSNIDGKYCIVEQSGVLNKKGDKTASSVITIIKEISYTELLEFGVEWLTNLDCNESCNSAQIGSSGDYAHIGSSGYSAQICSSGHSAQIGSSGDYAQIGSSGDYAKIGSSGNSAQIESTGNDSIICCAGHDSMAKAKVGSWITLSEWVYSKERKRYIPKCVKTEFVDGERIKADTWYKLIDGQFVEYELSK
jgi:hypothetical protein